MNSRCAVPDPAGPRLRCLLAAEERDATRLRKTQERLAAELRRFSTARGLTVPMRAEQVRAEIAAEKSA